MSDSKHTKSDAEPTAVDAESTTAEATPTSSVPDESSTTATEEEPAPVDAEPSPALPTLSSTPKSTDLAAPATPTGAAGGATPTAASPSSESPVAYLASMFPEVPADTLEAVLTAHEGSVESAIESLLGMTDGGAAAAPPTQSVSQMQIDEALAKQLAAEDARAAHSARALRSQGQQHPQQQSSLQARQGQAQGPPPAVTYQAYVPRSKRGGAAAPAAGGQAGAGAAPQFSPAGIEVGERERWHDQGAGERHRDELDELTENFAKFADQGKKTFAGLWGKAKEQAIKINQQINESASPSSASGSNSAPPPPAKTAPQPVRKSSLPSRYTAQSEAASEKKLPVPEKAPAPAPVAAPTSAAPETAPSTSAAPAADATKEASPSTSAADAPTTEGEPKKDFSKIGLLPRQSISLLDKDRHVDDDSEDDLEYVKSPFDDD